MFDPEKPYATCGMALRTLYQQDGVYYNPSTKEPVDLADLSKSPAKPSQEALVCKFCGAKRATPEIFREHLLAVHPREVGPLNPAPSAEQPPVMFPESVAKEEPAVPAKPKAKAKGR